MKSPFTSFRGHTVLDNVGLFAVLGLFVANAFHFNIYGDYPFYRELFGALFVALSGWYLLTKTPVLRGGVVEMSRPISYLLVFPIALSCWSIIDPGEPLYGIFELDRVTEQVGEHFMTLYVLRNASLYLPLVVYLYLRGLSLQEIRLVALTAALVAPFSVLAYLKTGELAKMGVTLGQVVGLGGKDIAYNSYVPYLTFSVLCGIYLLFSSGGRLIKIVVLCCVAVTSFFIVASTSRQSVMFVLLAFFAFAFWTNHRGRLGSKWLTAGVTVVVGVCVFAYLTRGIDFASNFLDRFASAQGFFSDESSGRLDEAIEGLSLLKPSGLLLGAGLTCVINSGPHNDYIRWAQRIGIPLMVFGFLPFFMTFVGSARLVRRYRDGNTLFIFLGLTVGFTLFHSLFGYPREDANQAIPVYFGLALWFGAYREGLIPNVERSQKKAL